MLLVLAALGCGGDSGQSNASGAAGMSAAGVTPAAAGMSGGAAGMMAAGGAPAAMGGKLSFATDVYEMVIRRRCSACHNDAPSFGGLAFFPSAAMAYSSLIDMPAGAADANLCKSSGLVRVKPGDPEHSLLYLKLTKPPCGSQMPPAVVAQPTPEQVELVRKWIADGAAP